MILLLLVGLLGSEGVSQGHGLERCVLLLLRFRLMLLHRTERIHAGERILHMRSSLHLQRLGGRLLLRVELVELPHSVSGRGEGLAARNAKHVV